MVGKFAKNCCKGIFPLILFGKIVEQFKNAKPKEPEIVMQKVYNTVSLVIHGAAYVVFGIAFHMVHLRVLKIIFVSTHLDVMHVIRVRCLTIKPAKDKRQVMVHPAKLVDWGVTAIVQNGEVGAQKSCKAHIIEYDKIPRKLENHKVGKWEHEQGQENSPVNKHNVTFFF